MANCNYKVNIKDIQSKYSFKIFCAGDNAEVQAEIGNLEDLTTTAKNNLVSAINEVHSDTETNATAISGLQSSKEDKSNKVTSFSSTSTDTQYPSAKAVYDSQETQDETISTLETNLEETQEELDYYKTIYNVLPKVEGNGESITLDNTGESILKLDLKGQCKQDSSTGKNKLKLPNNEEQNGITFTRNDDGTFNISGTATANVSFGTYIEEVLTSGSYTLWKNTNETNLKVYVQARQDGTWLANLISLESTSQTTATISPTGNQTYFLIQVANGTTINLQNVKIQLESGSEKTTWEKNTGGQPSPSPDFPQQIHEVSGDNTIEVSGKNRLNPALLSQVSGYNTYNSTTGLWTTNTGTNTSYNRSIFYDAVGYSADRDASKIIKVKPGTTYTLKFYDATMVTYTLGLYKSDGTNITSFEGTADTLKTFTTPSNCEGLDIRRENPNTQLVFSKIMLIEGTYTSETIPPYEPYGDTYELSLGDIKMRGIGTYEDYFVRNSEGKWCKYNAIGEVVLDGSESWVAETGGSYATNPYFKTNNSIFIATYQNIKSNYFIGKNISATTTGGIQKSANLLVLQPSNGILTASDFKTWLGTHNTIAVAPLITPYLSPIESETLISQLDAIEKALGKDGQTNISQVNNDAPFKIYASALKEIE